MNLISLFVLTSALPMGFLPDSHLHKLMINYRMIYDEIVSISPAKFGRDRSTNGRGDVEQTDGRTDGRTDKSKL